MILSLIKVTLQKLGYFYITFLFAQTAENAVSVSAFHLSLPSASSFGLPPLPPSPTKGIAGYQNPTGRSRRRSRSRSSHCFMTSTVEEIPITAAENSDPTAAAAATIIKIRHQLFLGQVEGDGDLTGLKLWKTVPLPMIDSLLSNDYFSCITNNTSLPIQILELGSGCGLLGIGLAALLGPKCHVILTDAELHFVETTTTSSNDNDNNNTNNQQPPHEWTSLTWLEQNVQLNQDVLQEQQVSVKPLFWGNEAHIKSILTNYDDGAGVDFILGSELLYNNDAAFQGLLDTLLAFQMHNQDQGRRPLVILLGYKVRRLGEHRFFDMAQAYFDIRYIDIAQSGGTKSKKKRGTTRSNWIGRATV